MAQIGCGRWGANLVRTLAAHPLVHLALVVDPNPAAQSLAHQLAPQARVSSDLSSVEHTPLDAVVVASPGPCHAAHARLALQRGLHVFVEKPLTTSVSDALTLQALARSCSQVTMVGHLLLHHPAVLALLALVRSGRLGAVLSFRSERLSTPGGSNADGSLLWALAPHDISVLRALDPSALRLVRSSGRGPALDELEPLHLQLETGRGLPAHIFLSKSHRQKVRRMSVECERGTVLFDDVLPAAKLRLVQAAGVELVPYDESVTPLQAEVDAFVSSIITGKPPGTSFADGLAVVSFLSSVQSYACCTSASSPVSVAE